MKPEELGRRIKKAREARQLTLKAVEADAGISATHISEIERGKTSPTVGALLRIARALRRDPAYFLESNELAEVSLVTANDRIRRSLPEKSGTIEPLTPSIPGGRLQVSRIVLVPGKSHRATAHAHDGNEAAIVLAGAVRFRVAGQTHELLAGDAIHFDAALPHAYENASHIDDATMVWVSTRRDAS